MAAVSSRRPRRVLIIIAIIILLIVSTALGYIFSIRTPDSTYQTIENHFKSLEKSSSTLNNKLREITSAKLLTSSLVADIDAAASEYNSSLKSSVAGIETSNDQTLKETLSKYRPTLTNFGIQANNISAAIDKYWNILESCSGIEDKLTGVTSVTSFNTTMSTCVSAVEEAELAPASDFTNQFLSTYQKYSMELIAAYKQRVETKSSKASLSLIETTKEKMQTLAKSGLDLSPGGSPQGIEEIIAATATRKGMIIR